MDWISLLRAELESIAQRHADAEQAGQSARVFEEHDQAAAAEAEAQEAAAEYVAASTQLADLFLLLLRHAKKRRREALRLYLAAVLELDTIADTLARTEARKGQS